MTTNYCETIDLINRLVAEGATPTGSDQVVMEQVIEGVSRWIEAYCGRRFYPTTETRYYTAMFGDELFVEDLISLTSLQTDEGGDRTYEYTWAATDYDLLPDDAALTLELHGDLHDAGGELQLPGRDPEGREDRGELGLRNAGPGAGAEACLIQAARVFKRKDAPFGVTGIADLGELRMISELDPDVEAMLAPLRRLV